MLCKTYRAPEKFTVSQFLKEEGDEESAEDEDHGKEGSVRVTVRLVHRLKYNLTQVG